MGQVKILNIYPYDSSTKCEIPKVTFYGSAEPPVTIIIPHKCGKPLYPITANLNDEVIIVRGGKSIGHARIEGAKAAKNDWLVFMDSDAIYPQDYVTKVKYFIRNYQYPIMRTVRTGGLRTIPFLESGLVVRKDVFLDRVRDYQGTWYFGEGRKDVGYLFKRDAKLIPVKYHHSWTELEKKAYNTFKSVAGFITTTYALYNIVRKVIK